MSHEEELALGLAGDWAIDNPHKVVKNLIGIEKARRSAQIGTVPGAAKRAAAAGASQELVQKFAGGLSSPMLGAAIELGKGSYLIGKEGAREGHAEAGRVLAEEPLAYQAANLLVSPADALSKYGAARESKGKAAFEAEHMAPLNEAIAKEEKRVRGELFANQDVPDVRITDAARRGELEAARRALDPDWDLEARTMGLVRNLTRGQ